MPRERDALDGRAVAALLSGAKGVFAVSARVDGRKGAAAAHGGAVMGWLREWLEPKPAYAVDPYRGVRTWLRDRLVGGQAPEPAPELVSAEVVPLFTTARPETMMVMCSTVSCWGYVGGHLASVEQTANRLS